MRSPFFRSSVTCRKAASTVSGPPIHRKLKSEQVAGGYRLSGTKRYASGASSLARALITAHAQDGLRLFDVDLTAGTIERNRGSWQAVGMRDSDSQDISLDGTFVPLAYTVGQPGGYLTRPGFWHGSVGVAACWFGAALGCLRLLQRYFRDSACNDHCAAHIGSVATSVHAMQTVFAHASHEIDQDPADRASRTLRSETGSTRVNANTRSRWLCYLERGTRARSSRAAPSAY
jgi:alkylation response protein AidB-like acyl-CoA dehydrogenase